MLAIATAALLALSATAEATTSKYRYHSYEPSRYDHGHEAYAMRDYSHDPYYEGHYAHQDYREPYHDSYDEGYGGDAYSEVPTYTYEPTKSRQMYKQSYVYKRATDEMGVREDQVLVPFGGKIGKFGKVLKKVSKKVKRSAQDKMGAREGQFFIKKLIFPSPEDDNNDDNDKKRKDNGGNGGDEEDIQLPEDRSVARRKRSVGGKEDVCELAIDGGDGARCRGNFKRWAFNKDKGKCVEFTYGGCGGNENRFESEKKCEDECKKNDKNVPDGKVPKKHDKNREELSTCPLQIVVTTDFGWGTKGAREAVPAIFNTYSKGNFKVESSEHWVSVTQLAGLPRTAIWKDGAKWRIGNIGNLGTGRSSAWIESSQCPNDTGFEWKYFVKDLDSWVNAGRGLVVQEV